jgi:hypothetical protein
VTSRVTPAHCHCCGCRAHVLDKLARSGCVLPVFAVETDAWGLLAKSLISGGGEPVTPQPKEWGPSISERLSAGRG